MKRIKKEAVKRKTSRKMSLVLYPSSLEQLSSYGCSTPSTLIPNGMGATNPKFVKGGKKLKKTKHCTILKKP